MKILFLCSDLPFPPVSGGKIKSFKLLEHLCSQHEVVLATPLRAGDVEHLEKARDTFQLEDSFTCPVDRKRNLKNFLTSIAVGKTLNEYRSWSEELRSEISTKLEWADLIFADHYEVMQYIPAEFHNKTVLHTHNAEHMIWRRFARVSSNPLKKVALKFEASRIAGRERSYCESVRKVFAAPGDQTALEALGVAPEKFSVTYHLGDDTQLSLPDLKWQKTETSLLFIGTLTWEANIDGLLWFRDHCWEDVCSRVPNVVLTIGGKRPDSRIVEWGNSDPRVEVPGFVEDPEDYLKKARGFLVPLRFGSGMKVKVLNAMYRGIPAITTDIGTESLGTADSVHLAVGNTPEEFTEQTVRVLQDADYWQKLSANSRAFAAEKFTWKSLLENLEEVLHDFTT